jgi:hypothetical protein
MALSPYSGPRIRVRANVRIPARVVSGPGISQEIADGVLTTGLDLTELDPVVSIPDPSLYRLFVYNEGTDTWETTTLDNLPTTTTGDTYTGRGDAIYTFLSTDRYVELTTALTAARIWTLPVASTYPAGTRIVVQDAIGGITSTNTLTIAPFVSDTINGASTFVLNAAYSGVELRCDGVSKWSARVINDGSVGTAKISDLGVTTAKIAASAVTTAKIADANVTTAKILDANVTNAKLSDMAAATIKGRASGAGTGVPTDLTAAQARTALSSPGFTRRTSVALTTQTSVDFNTIPAGTVRIVVTFAAFSTNGTSLPIIQIGDSGGIETTGYTGSTSLITNAAATVASTLSSGFALSPSVAAATVFQGSVTLDLVDGFNTWAAFGGMGGGVAATTQVAGFKTLSGELDRVRITTVNGTDQMDAGSVNVAYFFA